MATTEGNKWISVQRITSQKARLAADIMRIVSPMMLESGYVRRLPGESVLSTNRRRLKLWLPVGEIRINGFAVDDVMAISEDGEVLTGQAGGGALFESITSFPLEDVMALTRQVKKNAALATTEAPAQRGDERP